MVGAAIRERELPWMALLRVPNGPFTPMAGDGDHNLLKIYIEE
jgi:hypothetical protein